ncbi:MAG: hemolysin family protein [Candidatus Margulisiibacteriota bacterium]
MDLVLMVGLLIVVNGLFAMSETAIVSAKKVKLEAAAEKGDTRAIEALRLMANPNVFFSSVQVGITTIGILLGVFGEAKLAGVIDGYLRSIPLLAAYHHEIGVVVVVAGITYVSLVFGELVPKRLALQYPDTVAKLVARPMVMISRISAPIIWLLSVSTNGVLALLRQNGHAEHLVTEEEINALMEQGKKSGQFEEAEQHIVERVFQLGDRKLGSLMTPKMDVVVLDLNDSFELNEAKILSSSYSTFPLCKGGLDDVVGMINIKTLLEQNDRTDVAAWARLATPPLFLPEHMKALKAIEKFKEAKTHDALVIDEFGDIQGLVTLNDVLEALIGEFILTDDEPEIVQRSDGSWLVDALIPFEEFLTHFEIEDVKTEDKTGFHTLGGFVLHKIKHIPKTGEGFDWLQFRFEVIDMDGNRIDKILVEQIVVPEDEGEDG